MPENCRMYWLHTLTPLHVGIGFGAGYIDLPIQREKTTGWPVVPGSAVKGVLGDAHGATDEQRTADPEIRAAFGKAGEDLSLAGALVFADARIVCLPVQSYFGTFAWVTCPMVLKRLARDLKVTGLSSAEVTVEADTAMTATGSILAPHGEVVLTDLDFRAVANRAEGWANLISQAVFQGTDASWQDDFKKRFVVVSDDNFNFLSVTACEINARVKISEKTKTVEKGALWYEESLPAESILAGLIWCDGIHQKRNQNAGLMDKFCNGSRTLQIGGKASVGRGRTRCVFGNGTAGIGASA